jgi:ATP-binding cassette subfamily B protein
MAALLISYGLWLPLLLVAGTLPALYVVLDYNRRHHHWWEKTTADRRRVQYYDTLLVTDAFAAEMRLFNLGPHFRAAFQTLRHRLRTERIGLTKRQGLAQLAAGAVATLTTGVAMVWMIWQAFRGLVTLGDLVLFYQAFNRGQSLLRALLGNLGQIYSNTLFLGSLFEFLELEPQIVDPPQPIPAPKALHRDICFRQVAFRYPGSERAVFQDFNFVIPAGKIIAIVGANGAGKTTLVKLLCRFYDTESGCVELDGIDIRNLSLDELRRMITVLFQFPVPYHATAAENIAMGAMSDAPTSIDVEVAAHGAGAHDFIMRLPQGYDTLLGKWFSSGTELSGGEWQRLALARAYLRRAQIIILDEPTSFMDSWAEVDWFDRLQQLADGRTAIVITHRFTIAKRADEIHVMDDGQIVESGSHDELLAKGGLYAQSWTAQMQARTRQPNPDADHRVLEMQEALVVADTTDLSPTDGSFGRP